MSIFGSVFKSGRTTPQIFNHPFTEGADPPTPVTASPGKAEPTLPAPSSNHYQISRSPAKPRNESPRTKKSGETPSPSTKARRDFTATTPSSAGQTYSSSTKWCKSVASTPIATLPPSLPPPAYALPPTPEASPDRRASAIHNGTQGIGHARKPSLGLNSKTLPAPPSSYTSPNTHIRTGSAPLSITQSSQSRARSGSASISSRTNTAMGGLYPSLASTRSTLDVGSDSRSFDIFGHGSHEPKHRPVALKLKTSNLDPQLASSSRIRIKMKHSVEATKEFDEKSHKSGIEIDAVKSSGLFNVHLHRPDRHSDQSLQVEYTPTPIQSSRPSPVRHQSEETIRPSSHPHEQEQIRAERPRSFSTNDVMNITEMNKLRSIDETPRKQRSQPTFKPLRSPSSPTLGHRNCVTPGLSSAMSDTSATPGSTYTSLPTTTSTPGVKPFDNLPIPWCTKPSSELLAEIGEEPYIVLIEHSLSDQMVSSPRLLHPVILENPKFEEIRLRAELSRLKGKHFLLVNQRESLTKKIEQGIFKLDQIKLHKMVQALGQALRRVDRVSRQIYICNDQIRQIEIEAREHSVGVIKISLKKGDKELNSLKEELGSIIQNKQNQDEVETHAGDSVNEDSNCISTPRSNGSATTTTTTVRFLEAPTPSPKSPVKISLFRSSRPLSTATMLNINSLSFPIPPDRKRDDPSSSGDPLDLDAEKERFECTTDGGLTVQICENEDEAEQNSDAGMESTDSHTTAISITGLTNEILIYPPGHHRSLSASIMGLEVPLSAYRSEDGHQLSNMDMCIIDDSNHQCRYRSNHERSISESVIMTPPGSSTMKITAPLSIKSPMSHISQGRSRRQVNSLTVRGNENREETVRARMGRESLLETPESILLSLATAPIWTKQDHGAR
ncbi:hypothetical protein L486_04686 [Kwoniella mangroviensis CBS 10435]|uniref:Uncharacterized protein n=1 Tax=Kwoniella mangroviensis CBS 10435 TaxID=1331196 RepID=A0A1B9IPB6_9TREE|nr:hypothetical protein L486_04686 [Kwoniella mangroviensis CBS 10435]